MISVYKSKECCSGCTACRFACPVSAIDMIQDDEGFLYPYIIQEKCINCGKCRKVCNFKESYDHKQSYQQEVLAVKHLDDTIRMSSTSGGMFTAMSDYIIDNNGVVYGACFDENLRVIHKKATSKDERDLFKGSKYVQSDLNNVLIEIKTLLEQQNLVLFCGTPCQVAGLKGFLSDIDTQNLFTCDLVCHGVTSPMIWNDHLKHLEIDKGIKVINYSFRSKMLGWHSHTEVAEFENGKKEYLTLNMQRYKLLYHSNYILRPSCYNCVFANYDRLSDITLGDFWGIDRVMPDYDDNKGISLVLINSHKGKILFDHVKEKVEYRISSKSECVQPNLECPTKKPETREVFWDDYFREGYKYVTDKYFCLNKRKRLKYFIIRLGYNTGLLSMFQQYIRRC